MPKSVNILLADDDRDDHYFFQYAIDHIKVLGHNIISVYNGKQLCDYLNNNEQRPDLIVLDLNMPIMDGVTAMQKMKKIQRMENVPVFVLSTSKKGTISEQCKHLGCRDYYTKVSNMPELKSIIEDMLFKSAPDVV